MCLMVLKIPDAFLKCPDGINNVSVIMSMLMPVNCLLMSMLMPVNVNTNVNASGLYVIGCV